MARTGTKMRTSDSSRDVAPKKSSSSRDGAPSKRRAPAASDGVPRRFWPYGWLLFIVLFALDQWTKWLVHTTMQPGESFAALPGVWITYVQNAGITWGLFQGVNGAMIWLSVAAFGLLVFYYDRFTTVLQKIAYALIMVGLWGNLIDRGAYGYVIDFVDVHWWPVFNVADSCITVAIVLLVIAELRRGKETTPSRTAPARSR